MNELVSLAHTKRLGAFYTPSSTADVLARWGVREGGERVLEPSAGSGSLIQAVVKRAEELGQRCEILAFDIDEKAFAHLQNLKIPNTKIILDDFLSSNAVEFEQFDFVIANPPFIRNHSLDLLKRKELRERFSVPPSAGIWASFLAHSLAFLKVGGRMAAIVPRSILFTRHGEKILKKLCKDFCSVGVYSLSERPKWSTHADELGALILADGFSVGSATDYVVGSVGVDGVPAALVEKDLPGYRRVLERTITLGQVAKVSIGAVTGRNKVFLLSEKEMLASGVPLSEFRPIVSRARHISGLKVSRVDLAALSDRNEKAWLLYPSKMSRGVKKYLQVVSADELSSVHWFKKRDPWWRVQIDGAYEAVLTYMNDSGPKIAFLQDGIVCTNTLHRIGFFEGVGESVKISASLTLVSTFGQLAAEMIGRSYGGGVLKFEISEARQLPVLVNSYFDSEIFERVNELLREGLRDEARDLVDQQYMPAIFGDSWRLEKDIMLSELESLRTARRG